MGYGLDHARHALNCRMRGEHTSPSFSQSLGYAQGFLHALRLYKPEHPEVKEIEEIIHAVCDNKRWK